MKEFARYRILDYYDGENEVLGTVNTGKEAYNLFAQRVLDTDGECYLSYAPVSTIDTTFEKVLRCARNAVWSNFYDDCLDIEDDE